ncbi:transglutaminase-like cysteine peptidase [Mesorhizobium sp. M0323]|uniref:transglutaminase-like cysteine peptidase n=1 Tax=Mesorhizobium sp. M0323 TaxID=2956938 RepID=UPI003339BF61
MFHVAHRLDAVVYGYVDAYERSQKSSVMVGECRAAHIHANKRTDNAAIGHYEYCRNYRDDCSIVTRDPKPVELTRSLCETLIEINNRANTTIMAMTDINTRVEEKWEYPYKGFGDCDDIVLEKRRELMRQGVPLQNLLDNGGQAVERRGARYPERQHDRR